MANLCIVLAILAWAFGVVALTLFVDNRLLLRQLKSANAQLRKDYAERDRALGEMLDDMQKDRARRG